MPTDKKYWSYVCKLHLPELDRGAIEKIFQENLGQQMSNYNMNRDVQEFISSKAIKACLIVVDDLTNVIGLNEASALMLGLMRNLLSLPKKQGHCSLEQYEEYFKTHLHAKLQEKCHN
jgi:hypothetical protein